MGKLILGKFSLEHLYYSTLPFIEIHGGQAKGHSSNEHSGFGSEAERTDNTR